MVKTSPLGAYWTSPPGEGRADENDILGGAAGTKGKRSEMNEHLRSGRTSGRRTVVIFIVIIF